MNALQDWLDFRDGLAHPPTRAGFCAAWRQMSGTEPPVSAVTCFGRLVLRLFICAVDDVQRDEEDELPGSMIAVLADARKTGLLLGFKPSDYGYDISIVKLKTPKEPIH